GDLRLGVLESAATRGKAGGERRHDRGRRLRPLGNRRLLGRGKFDANGFADQTLDLIHRVALGRCRGPRTDADDGRGAATGGVRGGRGSTRTAPPSRLSSASSGSRSGGAAAREPAPKTGAEAKRSGSAVAAGAAGRGCGACATGGATGGRTGLVVTARCCC